MKFVSTRTVRHTEHRLFVLSIIPATALPADRGDRVGSNKSGSESLISLH